MDTIKKLTELFARFPAIGKRTAGRFVFHMINMEKKDIDELIAAMQELKNNITFCSFCFQPFERMPNDPMVCNICSDPGRNYQIMCVVEKESDLATIEATKKYKGLYFILGGVLTFRKNPEDLRIEPLKERIKDPQKFGIKDAVNFSEIIVATNPTPEGKATSALVQRALKESPQSAAFKITHLAKGLPVGGELEYADEETLESAFEGRK